MSYNNDSDNEDRVTSGEYYQTRYSDGRLVYSPTSSVLNPLISGALGQNTQYHGAGSSQITSSYDPHTHFQAILTRIQNTQAPIEVRNTENIRVIVDGVPIEGVWVNKDDSEQWRPDHPSDKRNPLDITTNLSVSSSNATIIKKQYLTSGELVQNINIKFLKPPPPCVGDLVIEQLADTYSKPLPPIWIREKQATAGRLPDQVYREKPRILDCVPESIIKIDGKVHPAPTRQVIVERMPKLEAKPGDIYVERWLGIPKMKRLVKYKKHKTESNVQQGKDVIIDWNLNAKLRATQKFNYLGIDAPVDPERYIIEAQQRNWKLDDQQQVRAWPDFTNYYNGQVRTQGEVLLIDQDRIKPSEYDLTFENDSARQQFESLRNRRSDFKEFLEWPVKYKN